MKRVVNPVLAALILTVPLRAAEPIQSVRLDDSVVTVVAVATNRVTTLSFPGPITAIDAANVSADPKSQSEFQLAHTKGSSFLSVRALGSKASGNLNIHWDHQTYVFELIESSDPVLALNLKSDSPPVAQPAPRLSPTALLALLDKAKAFQFLKKQYPSAVAGVEVRTYAGTNPVSDFGDFEIRLEEAYRFNLEDSLVFRAVIRNKVDAPLEYRPESFTVRAGNHLYPQSISDGSGNVPPYAETPVYFALTGTPDGGRNELSLKNDFTVHITRTSPRPAASPIAPAPTTNDPPP